MQTLFKLSYFFYVVKSILSNLMLSLQKKVEANFKKDSFSIFVLYPVGQLNTLFGGGEVRISHL